MQSYETVFVLDPQLEDDPIEKHISSVEQLITSRQGEIVGIERWGRRKLGYEINRRQQGFYTLVRFNANPTTPSELDRFFKLNEQVLRHQILRVKNHNLANSRLLDDEYGEEERR